MPLRTRNVKAGGVKEERAHVPSNDARMRGAQCPCRATKVRKYSEENGKATRVPCKDLWKRGQRLTRMIVPLAGEWPLIKEDARFQGFFLMGLTMRAGLSKAELK